MLKILDKSGAHVVQQNLALQFEFKGKTVLFALTKPPYQTIIDADCKCLQEKTLCLALVTLSRASLQLSASPTYKKRTRSVS